jgi:putative endopeptidase
MIRRYGCALLAFLFLIFPLTLSSQSSGSHRGTESVATAAEVGGGCAGFAAQAAGGTASPAQVAARADRGFDLANLDRSVSPCDDFYKFAAGGWMKNNPIPPDRPRWAAFDKLRNDNESALHQILEEAAKDKAAKPGSNWQKIGDFYASCTNESQVESAGLKPLEPELRRIAEINDTATLQAEIARLQRVGVNAVFAFGSEQDLKNSTEVIAGAGQGGLGLPDRQYYVDDDESSKQLRAGYIQHVTNMFKLMGDDATTAAAEAKSVLDAETALAKASKKREDLRDPQANYHRLTLAQLSELTPNLSWAAYFKEVGAPALADADIGQLDFFKQVNAGLASVPLDDWKTYLRWHLIHAVAGSLPAEFVDESFNFYGRTLTGAKQLLPRWQRCVQATDAQLGEALGQYYVERNFPPEAKARALAMVKNLIGALRDDLSTLDWMSPETRQQAIAKLDLINLKIGYPDKWRDYTAFEVNRGPYLENVLRGNAFEVARDLAKIGKPLDRTEWGMTPPTVNAYYNASLNEIVFPAGILQPPFFNAHADDAINYGGIGSVIGHEMTHGFDDQGAQFDGHGNLKNWWTPEDLKNFKARGECIVNQFSAYEVEPGLYGNGKLEEGESIADLGGMTIAHAAFEKTLEGKPALAPIDGFTAEQRFFLGWAQIWAANLRPEFARLQAKTNEHPLNQFRGIGAPSNTPAFAKAFGCTADSKMIRPEGQRCRIW